MDKREITQQICPGINTLRALINFMKELHLKNASLLSTRISRAVLLQVSGPDRGGHGTGLQDDGGSEEEEHQHRG